MDWFNQVDATYYRTDLRELNELNFARFDAKLEQRLTELDAKWVVRWDKLDAKLEQRLAELDAKWGRQWDRLDGKLEQRLAELDTKLDGKVDRVAAELNATLERAPRRADPVALCRLGEPAHSDYRALDTGIAIAIGRAATNHRKRSSDLSLLTAHCSLLTASPLLGVPLLAEVNNR